MCKVDFDKEYPEMAKSIREHQREPAKVESGDGLPPDENTQEDSNRGQEIWQREYLFADEDRKPFALVKSYRRQATLERQLKASLLREQKLKELLKECYRILTTDSTGKEHDEVIQKLFKAAVKGE